MLSIGSADRSQGSSSLSRARGYPSAPSDLTEPLFLLYLDLGAILDELIEEGEVDLDDWNAAALRGFGLSWDIEDRVGRFRFVVPISDPEGGE